MLESAAAVSAATGQTQPSIPVQQLMTESQSDHSISCALGPKRLLLASLPSFESVLHAKLTSQLGKVLPVLDA